MLLLINISWDEILETFAERVQLRVIIRALLSRYPYSLLLQFVRLTALGRQVSIVAMGIHMGTACARIVLFNLRVGGPFSIDVKRL